MEIAKTVADARTKIQEARNQGWSVGLVPTMGALHAGHGSLISAAKAENDFVVVSIFVNPTQFAPTEDLDAYPRTWDADLRLAERLGADLIFAPPVPEMYPEGDCTRVEVVGPLTQILCGRSRPTHFRGVSTVVAKLFGITWPDRAYFGQKDGQQAQVIRRMTRDLFLPIDIRVMPIIRETDGLAMSSRNAYLSGDERRGALALSKALALAQKMIIGEGQRDRSALLAAIERSIREEPLARLDYAEIYTFPDLAETGPTLQGQIFIGLAVKFGGARLIDNAVIKC